MDGLSMQYFPVDLLVLFGLFFLVSVFLVVLIFRSRRCPPPRVLAGEIESSGKRKKVSVLTNLVDFDMDAVMGGSRYYGIILKTPDGENKFDLLRVGKDLDAALGDRIAPGFKGVFFVTRDRVYAVHDGEKLHYFRTDILRRWDLLVGAILSLIAGILAVMLPILFESRQSAEAVFLVAVAILFFLISGCFVMAYCVRRRRAWRVVESEVRARFPDDLPDGSELKA